MEVALDFETEVARQLDFLVRQFPGKMNVSLAAACQCTNISRHTFYAKRSTDAQPFRAILWGNKFVVPLTEIAAFNARQLVPMDAHPVEETPEGAVNLGKPRFGRPTREEEARARDLGFENVAALRAAQRRTLQEVTA